MIFAMESQDSGYVQSLKKGMIKVLSAVSWRLLFYLLSTYLGCSTCLGGTSAPQPGIRPVEVWSPKHWTFREFLLISCYLYVKGKFIENP